MLTDNCSTRLVCDCDKDLCAISAAIYSVKDAKRRASFEYRIQKMKDLYIKTAADFYQHFTNTILPLLICNFDTALGLWTQVKA